MATTAATRSGGQRRGDTIPDAVVFEVTGATREAVVDLVGTTATRPVRLERRGERTYLVMD